MAAILSVIISIFTQVATFFVARFGVQIAIRIAVAAAWIAACIALVSAITAILQTLYAAVPDMVQQALSLLPSNTSTCIGAIGSTYAACWVYQEVSTLIAIKGRV